MDGGLPPTEPEEAVAGIHFSYTSLIVPLFVLCCLQIPTKRTLRCSSHPPRPLVQTVVQLKTLSFYDVPGVLIKPMSLKQYSTISREVFIFGLTFELVKRDSISRDFFFFFLPGGSAETLLGRNKLSPGS